MPLPLCRWAPRFAQFLAAAVLTPAGLHAGGLVIEPPDLPAATVGRSYRPEPLRLAGGQDCLPNHARLRVVWGQLPEGVELGGGGYFSGVPARAGLYSFIVRAWNGCTWADRGYHLRVEAAPVLVVWPPELVAEAGVGSSAAVEVKLLVSATVADLPYWLDPPGEPWLEAIPLRGRTPAPGSAMEADVVRVRIDPARLPPGVHHARIRVRAWRGVNAPEIPLRFVVHERQAGKAADQGTAALPRNNGW